MVPHAVTEVMQATGAVAAAGRLLGLNLARRFPALFGYLVFLAALNLVLSVLNVRSVGYFYAYVVLEPLKCLISIGAVRELFALTLEDYPGIRTAGRWTMYAGVTLAVGISLLITILGGGVHGRSKLFYFEVAQRWVVFTLAFVIAAILWLLSKFPLHLRPNALRSSTFFSVLFLADACRLFIDSVAPRFFNNYVDRTESVFACVCLLAWAALMKREGETVPTRVTFSAAREDHLLQQLTALNQMMTRAARR